MGSRALRHRPHRDHPGHHIVRVPLQFSRLKTKTSRRNITVDTDTMARLAEFRRHQGARLEAERLGHSNPSFTMMTYQHVLPGMQEDAANSFGQLLTRDIGEFDQSPIAA